MINKAKIEQSFKNFHSMMDNLSATEKEILKDKMLAWLLFQPSKDALPVKAKEAKKITGRKKNNPISKKDQELIKKIADKTDELYKRLGGDTI